MRRLESDGRVGNAVSWGAEELRATLDSVGTGIWALDLEGRCVFINKEADRLLGNVREKCAGHGVQCMIHRGRSDEWACPKEECPVRRALETGAATTVEDDVFHRCDGTLLPVRFSVQPVVAQGRVAGVVVSFTDTTPHKRMEASLRKTEEWLRFAQNATGVGIFDLDLQTGAAKVSDGQFRLFGLDPKGEWPTHAAWRKLVHPDDIERMDRVHEMMLLGAQPSATEYRILWPDGSAHWLLMNANVFVDEAGRATRVVGANVDITDRVLAEKSLNQFFSASPTPLAIWNFEGRILRASPSWEPVIGFTTAELEGQSVFEVVHPDDRAAAAAEFEKVLAFGKTIGFECRAQCKSGEYRWLLVNASVLNEAQVIYATAQDITSRKEAEEALRASEARFRSAFENPIFGIAVTGLDGRFLQVNPSLCRITGYSEHELLALDFGAITHPEDVRGNVELLQGMAECRTASGTLTKRYLRKDGTAVWVRGHVALVRDAVGRPLHIIALIEDITGQRQAEENARRSEEWLQFTLDAAGIGFRYRDGEKSKASPQQFRLYGLEPAEDWIAREDWLRSIHPADRERVEAAETLAVEQGGPYDTEFRALWPDGSVHWLLCRGKQLDEGGKARKAEVTVDITERKRAEEALELFFALSSSPMAIVGFDGLLRRANAGLLKTSGFSEAELTARPLFEFFHPDDLPVMGAEIGKLIAGGGHTEFECRGLRKDGSFCHFLFSATAAPDERLIFTVSHDISERKRMVETLKEHAEKLERSNSELERFAYVASHDLQEPLRMVASFTQLLSKRYTGKLDETADRYIEYAVDGAKRMQLLISDLLAYSRVNSKELNLRPTDCGAVVRGAMASLAAAIEESGAVVECGELPRLLADQGQLTQLFQNLLANAIKFRRVGESPRIQVSAADRGAEWLFSVQDNGIGIDPHQSERVFQIFQRLHNRTEYPGTGIGLAICQKVVERHGGKIWVESEPGVGSTFRFTIPKRREREGLDDSVGQTGGDSVS